MGWFLTIMAVLITFTYAFYVRAILSGNADLTENSMSAALADWLVRSGKEARKKVWLYFWGSLFAEGWYLYTALMTIDNMAFDILTATALGVETYALSSLHQRLTWFFRGRIPLGNVLKWKTERISALVMFTHALMILLYPITTWF